MGDSIEVSVSLGEISLEGNKSWESNIGKKTSMSKRYLVKLFKESGEMLPGKITVVILVRDRCPYRKVLTTHPVCHPSLASCLSSLEEFLPYVSGTYAVDVSDVPGAETHVHTHNPGGSEAPDRLSESILSSEPKPLDPPKYSEMPYPTLLILYRLAPDTKVLTNP
nr:hypothetical protein [Tanacetum cinerariifolium]